jgi:hypothetical protein
MMMIPTRTTPWSKVLQELVVIQLVKKFPASYEIRRFIIVFIGTRHWLPKFISVLFSKVKVKCKVIPVPFLTEHHAMKAYWGIEGIAPRIL